MVVPASEEGMSGLEMFVGHDSIGRMTTSLHLSRGLPLSKHSQLSESQYQYQTHTHSHRCNCELRGVQTAL